VTRSRVAAAAAIIWLGLFPSGCSRESAATKPDTIPPQAIADLHASTGDRTSITLRWTAVGDDGTDGRAAAYDLRYGSSPIADSTWGSATQVAGEPTPHDPGETETFTLTDLTPGRVWYFALKVADEAPNWSGLSNVGSFATLPPDTIPPAAIHDVRIVATGEDTVTLTWTSVGDDSLNGRASGVYFLYSTFPIDEGTWSDYGPFRPGGKTPTSPGTPDSLTVPSLDPATNYYFSVRTGDAAGNWGGLSNPVSGVTGPAIPPATVTDLTLLATSEHALTIGWTAVGDDGMIGTRVLYEIHVSTIPIDESNWDTTYFSRAHAGEGPPGTQLTAVIGLPRDSTYYVALKAEDDAGTWSALSNVISGRTTDTTPPPGIVDLRVSMPASPAELDLMWTAVGDDGTTEAVSKYDIRYSSEPITDASWGDAAQIQDSSRPQAVGATETFSVNDFEIGRYYFAMKVRDEAGNWSVLSNIALGIVPLRLEAESYSDSRNSTRDPIARVSCSDASGSKAVDGVDGDGDWIQIPFEIRQRVCFTDSLRCGGALALRRTFAIDYYRQVQDDTGALVASDSVAMIPGNGIGCSSTNFDFIGSTRIVCLDPGPYLARIRRIGRDPGESRIDCLDLRESADRNRR
jgi:hypothetical protein